MIVNKNNIMKKFFVCLLCLLVALPMLGCGGSAPQLSNNAISMQLVSGNGYVNQNFAFPANVDGLIESGASEQQAKEYVEDLVNQIRLKVWNKLFLNYFAIYSDSPDNRYVIGGDLVKFTEADYNDASDCVEFSFRFASVAAWNYYHPKTDSQQPEEGEGGVFIEKDTSSAEFVFSQKVNGQTVGELYYQIIQSVMAEHFMQQQIDSLEKPSFRYDYVTYHKRVHSNADIKYYDGLYHHVWQQDFDKLDEAKTVEISTANANRGWWYLVALAAALVAAGVGCATIYLINLRKKKAKKEA